MVLADEAPAAGLEVEQGVGGRGVGEGGAAGACDGKAAVDEVEALLAEPQQRRLAVALERTQAGSLIERGAESRPGPSHYVKTRNGRFHAIWPRARNHLEFLILSERLAQLEGEGPIQPPLPTIVRPTGATSKGIRPIIHATGGLSWSQIRIEIAGNQSIRFHAPGQEATHTFSRREKPRQEHPLGVLMTLAAHGEWHNPSKNSPDYDRTCKAFQRLQQLLRALVPLTGKPFRRSRGGYVPLFQVGIHQKLRGGDPELAAISSRTPHNRP